MRLLQTEAELNEIVQLVGVDALSHGDRLILETARSIREDFLHQNSFHEVDTYTSLHKQYRMMKLILTFYKEANEAIKQGVTIQKLTKMDVIERIGRAKYVEEMNVDKSYDEIEREIKTEVAELIRKGADEL
jgi:V/A-type H+-transporting ATPase subunit A